MVSTALMASYSGPSNTMAVKTLIATCLLSSLTLTTARQQDIRRQDSRGIYTNTTKSSLSHIAQPSSSALFPEFSFEPQQDSTTASPASAPSTTPVASTFSSSSHHFAPSPFLPSGPPSLPSSTASRKASSGIYPQSGFSFRPTTTAIVNNTCGGATLNVLNATLDWWWTDTTAFDPVSTLSFQHNKHGSVTGWTIFGESTTLDVSSALTTYTCDPTPATYTYADSNSTYLSVDCPNVVTTVAPATTGVTITGYITPNKTTGTGWDDVPHYKTHPGPPEATIAGFNTTFGTDSPYVYFSAYEIVSSNFTKRANGHGVCNSITRTYNMSIPYAFSYTGPDPATATNSLAAITGDLDPYLPTALGRPSLILGSFTAVPTVIVIVEQIFAAQAVLYLAHTELTVTKLDVPTPTLPPGISATASDTSDDAYNLYTSLTANTHVEMSNHVLMVPSASTTLPVIAVQSLVDNPAQPAASRGSAVVSDTVGFESVGNTPGVASQSKPKDALDVLTAAGVGGFIMQGIGGTAVPAQTIDVAGATATAVTVSGYVLNGQTAVAGGPAITASSTVLTVLPGGQSIVVGGSTVARPGPGASIIVDGAQITEVPATIFVVAGQTLLPGGPGITISSTTVSLAPGGGAMIIGSTTSLLQTRVITVGTQTITANAATQFVFASGQTLTQGGSLVIGGTTISLASGATALIVNGKSESIVLQATTTVKPALTIDGQTFTATGAGVYVISGQTLSPGGAITFTGLSGRETVSLEKSGTIVADVVSGQSTTITLQVTTAPVLTVGGQRFTAQAGSTYVVDGQTLTPGGARTVVVGGSTYILSLSATPSVVEIEQVGPSGQVTATTYETLLPSTATPGGSIANTASTTSSAGPTSTSPTTGLTLPGKASSLAFELASIILSGGALFFAIWL